MKRTFEFYLLAHQWGTNEMGGPFKITRSGFRKWTVEWSDE